MIVLPTDIHDDEYEGLSDTFARACRAADRDRAAREQFTSFRQRDRDHLPASTTQAIDWLLKYTDEQRLENFIAGRSAAEIAKIHDYIRGKLNADHS
jgi:hypothetical protein